MIVKLLKYEIVQLNYNSNEINHFLFLILIEKFP